jgi:hypothetical protein
MFEIETYKPGRSKFWRLRNDARRQPQPWSSPLVRLGDRDPIVIAEVATCERRGVDLGYAPRPYDHELYVPVHAAQDGDVMCAAETACGFALSIEHREAGLVTHYAQMSRMFVTPYYGQRDRKRQRVRAGEVIGYAAKSPIQIRFEVWQWTNDRGFVAVDPQSHLEKWRGAIAQTESAKPVKKAA